MIPCALAELAGAGDVAEWQVVGGGCVLLGRCCGPWWWLRSLGAAINQAGGAGEVAQRWYIVEVVGGGGH